MQRQSLSCCTASRHDCCCCSFHQVRVCAITLVMTLFWNTTVLVIVNIPSGGGLVSEGCCFNSVFVLFWKFFFYCVVKCKPTSSYESACGEAEMFNLSIKILAFWRMLYHIYQSLELLSFVSFKSIICLVPILKLSRTFFYEQSSYQNKYATKKSGAWITEYQAINIQLL